MDTSVSLNGNDIIRLNNRVLFGLATGDNAELRYPNELVAMKTGKDGNTVYAFNATGKQCELDIRVLLGSADDAMLNQEAQLAERDLPSYSLMTGELIKRVGDGRGNVGIVTYILDGGVISKKVEAKSNVEGDTDQAIALYHLKFSNSRRAIM